MYFSSFVMMIHFMFRFWCSLFPSDQIVRAFNIDSLESYYNKKKKKFPKLSRYCKGRYLDSGIASCVIICFSHTYSLVHN